MKACAHCGASLADDQRYCLECGGRQVQARSQFLDRFTPAAVSDPAHPSSGVAAGGGRSSGATAVAGVGVLLLAMGVGVLIGRASGGKAVTEPAQVISVASPAAATPGSSTATTPALPTSTGSSPSAAGTPKSGGSSSTSANGKGSSSSSSGQSSKSGGASKTKSSSPSSGSNSGQSYEQKSRALPDVVTTG
jgi:hypothetical protein